MLFLISMNYSSIFLGEIDEQRGNKGVCGIKAPLVIIEHFDSGI